MYILLDLQITYSSVKNLDLSNKIFLNEVVDTFKNKIHFKDLKYYGSGAKLKKIEMLETSKLAEKITKSSLISLCDHATTEDNRYRFRIDFFIRETETRMLIELHHIESKDINNSINFFTKSLDKFLNIFKGKIELDLVSNIRLPNFEYPRIRPPKFTGRYATDAIVDIVNPHKIEFEEEEKITKNLCFNELPNSVARHQKETYYWIDWASKNTPKSLTDLQKILTERERWFYANGDFELHGFNEAGDEADGLWGATPTEYLTLYQAFD